MLLRTGKDYEPYGVRCSECDRLIKRRELVIERWAGETSRGVKIVEPVCEKCS